MAETILVACSGCQREGRIAATYAGKRVACPHCGTPISVPQAPAPTTDRLAGKTVGGCRLVRRLGAGALGVVYEAEQLSTGRTVALKLLSTKAAADPELLARFEREAKLCAAAAHPHVIAVHDCGFERGVHFLIMEYAAGGTLAGLADEGAMPWRRATAFAAQLARGLAHVHAAGIVHRDIKPANVLLNADATVAKLADLGLAKRVSGEGDPGQSLGLTMQGIALGSPAYMPPEQIRDAKNVGPTADLYALGVTIFQLVAGRLPFGGRTATDVMSHVLTTPAPRLSSVAADAPPALCALVDALLSKHPDERPQSAQEVAEGFTAVLAAPQEVRFARRQRPTPRPASAAQPASAPTAHRSARGWLIAAGVVVILAGAGLGYLVFGR